MTTTPQQSLSENAKSPPEKIRVLFVSAFPGPQKNDATGGQLYATMTLLRSPLSEYVSWLPLNSALDVVPPPPVYRRAFTAFNRVLIFIYRLLTAKVDVVLIFAANGPSLLEKGLMTWIAKRCGRRVVFCPRSGLILDDFARNGLYGAIARRVLRSADVVVCQGNFWRDTFQREVGPGLDRFITIPNWIEVDPRNQFVSPETSHTVTILYLGWIETFKGIFDLICAVAGHSDQLRSVKIVICGGGSRLAEAQTRVKLLGLEAMFEFTGWVNAVEKRKWLARADVFVLPSHFEGMPNALLEAMAAGKACVATEVGGVPDLIPDASVGRMVPPRNPIALGDALEELANNRELRIALGRASFEHIISNNDVNRAYPRLYWALAGRPLPSATGRPAP